MSDTPSNGGVLRYRVEEQGKSLSELIQWRGRVDTDRVIFKKGIEDLSIDVHELATAVEGLRRTILGFAITIAGSAIVALFTVLVATGKL